MRNATHGKSGEVGDRLIGASPIEPARAQGSSQRRGDLEVDELRRNESLAPEPLPGDVSVEVVIG